jgi:hypothetical protein
MKEGMEEEWGHEDLHGVGRITDLLEPYGVAGRERSLRKIPKIMSMYQVDYRGPACIQCFNDPSSPSYAHDCSRDIST